MTLLRFEVHGWLGRADDPEEATLAELGIVAGPDETVITRVNDSLARTVRDTIRVPALQLAEWLAVHWWRLRWEPRPSKPGSDWRSAHQLSGVSGGFAWPPLEITSDGEFIQLVQWQERNPDVAAIQYVSGPISVEISAADFEASVDRFFDQVHERLALTCPSYRDFVDVRAELDQERADPSLSQRCRWQARAGFDAGDATSEWIEAIQAIATDAGPQAVEEVLGALGAHATGAVVDDVVGTFRRSGGALDLSQLPCIDIEAAERRASPWVQGGAAARRLRSAIGVTTGPLSDKHIEALVQTRLTAVPSVAMTGRLSGIYRPDPNKGKALMVARSRRTTSLRFTVARVAGLAAARPSQDRLLVLSDASTATQKFSRAFAQEFLLPWNELDAATDDDGTGPESIEAVADRYGVSEMVVATTLVNRGKLDRSELARFQ